MNRRSFICGVASSPILSLPVSSRDSDEKKIIEFNAKYDYIDSVKQILYLFEDSTVSTDVYDAREEWFNDVITEIPSFDSDTPRPIFIPDSYLCMISEQDDYCYSVHKSGNYEIQVYKGLRDHDLYLVQYYTDITENIDSFDAKSYSDLVVKLDERNIISKSNMST